MLDSIQSTTDYTIFHSIPGNRKVIKSHVQKLIASIQTENRLHLHPIIVKEANGRYYVKDGQHRLEAARRLNYPVYYVLDEGDLDLTIINDQIQRTWKTYDYLNFFCIKKEREYELFQDLLSNRQMTYASLFALIGSDMYGVGGAFKSGKLKISDFVKDWVKKTQAARLAISSKSSGWKTTFYRRDFILALKWFAKEYPGQFELLLEFLPSHFGELPNKAATESYQIHLVSLYNKYKRGGKKIHHPKDKRNPNQENEEYRDESAKEKYEEIVA
jgi:hypothetical protein